VTACGASADGGGTDGNHNAQGIQAPDGSPREKSRWRRPTRRQLD